MQNVGEIVERMKRLMVELRNRPEYLARGVAAGTFAAFFPIPGQMPAALVLAALVRGAPVPAAVMTYLSNPVTWPFLIVFGYGMGQWLRGLPVVSIEVPDSLEGFLRLGWDAYLSIWVGMLLVSIVTTPPAYFATLWMARRWRGSGDGPHGSAGGG